jgi:hypothetical protein
MGLSVPNFYSGLGHSGDMSPCKRALRIFQQNETLLSSGGFQGIRSTASGTRNRDQIYTSYHITISQFHRGSGLLPGVRSRSVCFSSASYVRKAFP